MGYLPPELEEASRDQQLHYVKMVEDGQTEQFAVMCALQQPPGTRGTDRSFMEGKLNQEWLNDMPRFQSERILREAKAAGISTTGRFYMSGLSDKRGHCDPLAWVSTTGEIKKVAQLRNLNVTGIIEHKAEQREPTKKKFSKEIGRAHV